MLHCVMRKTTDTKQTELALVTNEPLGDVAARIVQNLVASRREADTTKTLQAAIEDGRAEHAADERKTLQKPFHSGPPHPRMMAEALEAALRGSRRTPAKPTTNRAKSQISFTRRS